MKSKKRISKYLSFLLRHDPLMVDEKGWVDVQTILTVMKARHSDVTLSLLKEIVAEDAKQRYSFSQYEKKIKANQGHSIAIDLGLTETRPPDVLYHGTSQRSLSDIRRDGLSPMRRQYVHLSLDKETALAVGQRHGKPVVITIMAHEMFMHGGSFFLSQNGVWLATAVPVKFLNFEEDYVGISDGTCTHGL